MSEMIYGSNIATVGRTHVIIDAIEGDSVKVRELATDSCSAIFVSPNEPVVASYGKGDAFTIGGTKVGFLFGEAIVLTDEGINDCFRYHIKQRRHREADRQVRHRDQGPRPPDPREHPDAAHVRG